MSGSGVSYLQGTGSRCVPIITWDCVAINTNGLAVHSHVLITHLAAHWTLAGPIGLSPLTLVLSMHPFPSQVAVPIGLSPPSALDLPLLPMLTSRQSIPFPW